GGVGAGSSGGEPEGGARDVSVPGRRGTPRQKLCFVPTASGDAPEYTTKFYDASARRAEASHLYLFGRPRTDMARLLASQDIIYVGGGNTAKMLEICSGHGVGRVMCAAWEGGVLLTRWGAGSGVWYAAG